MIDNTENINVKPKFIPFRCVICNGFGTVSNMRVRCHACDGKGYIEVPPKEEGKE